MTNLWDRFEGWGFSDGLDKRGMFWLDGVRCDTHKKAFVRSLEIIDEALNKKIWIIVDKLMVGRQCIIVNSQKLCGVC